MQQLSVELIKSRFTAYEFLGTEESAKEFCSKWNFSYIKDYIYPYQYCVKLPSGSLLSKGNYLVVDGNHFEIYSKYDFESIGRFTNPGINPRSHSAGLITSNN